MTIRQLSDKNYQVASWVFYLQLVVYAFLVFFTVYHHEPWRDEAQAWLLGRDLSFTGLIREMGYDGSPPLWHLILSLLSSLGMPYASMSILHGLLAVFAVAVFLKKAPFGALTKSLFVFSYFMLYEYAVIARSYVLTVLLVFAIAATWRQRLGKPLLFALLLALLANTNTHSMPAAAALGLIYIYDISKLTSFKMKQLQRFILPAFILAAGFLFALISVFPPADSWKPGFANEFDYIAPLDAISQAFLPACHENPAMTLVLRHWTDLVFFSIVLTVFIVYISGNKPALFFFLFSLAGLVYILIFKHSGYLRHYGLILIFMLLALWIRELDDKPAVKRLQRTRALKRFVFIFLNLSLLVSIASSYHYIQLEYRKQFSGSRQMASYLLENENLSKPIVAYNVHTMTSLLPYLPGLKFWDPGLKQEYTFIHWDQHYLPSRKLPQQEVMQRALEHVGRHDFLLLLPRVLENPEQYHLYLSHHESGEDISSDEIYFLYKPSGSFFTTNR